MAVEGVTLAYRGVFPYKNIDAMAGQRMVAGNFFTHGIGDEIK